MQLPTVFVCFFLIWSQRVVLSFQLSESSFSFPLDLDNPTTQSKISEYSRSLAEDGVFLMKNFYNKDTLHLLQEKALNEAAEKGVRRDIFKSVFGDQVDDRFGDDHPRNLLGNLKMTFVGKSDLPSEFTDLYYYEPMRLFLQEILRSANFDRSKTHQRSWENLYQSLDAEGSVYVFLGGDGDRGEWHLDQHPVSCVHMLSKPTGGGRLLYAHNPPLKDEQTGEFLWDWKKFGLIQADSKEDNPYVSQLESEEGDVYCFQGNVTWHASGPIWGDKTRAILVTAYSDIPDFQHSAHVHELNAWGKHSDVAEKCIGNERCVDHDETITSSATDAVHRSRKSQQLSTDELL